MPLPARGCARMLRNTEPGQRIRERLFRLCAVGQQVEPAVAVDVSDEQSVDPLHLIVDQMQSTSDAPFHINTGGGGANATSEDMILLSSAGAGISLISLSTSRWLVDGLHAATFSSST